MFNSIKFQLRVEVSFKKSGRFLTLEGKIPLTDAVCTRTFHEENCVGSGTAIISFSNKIKETLYLKNTMPHCLFFQKYYCLRKLTKLRKFRYYIGENILLQLY